MLTAPSSNATEKNLRMQATAITVYCVESERGQTVARYFNPIEAQQFAAEQQRLRGRSPADRLHVVPREFVP